VPKIRYGHFSEIAYDNLYFSESPQAADFKMGRSIAKKYSHGEIRQKLPFHDEKCIDFTK